MYDYYEHLETSLLGVSRMIEIEIAFTLKLAQELRTHVAILHASPLWELRVFWLHLSMRVKCSLPVWLPFAATSVLFLLVAVHFAHAQTHRFKGYGSGSVFWIISCRHLWTLWWCNGMSCLIFAGVKNVVCCRAERCSYHDESAAQFFVVRVRYLPPTLGLQLTICP